MANNIALHEVFLDKLDEIYARESLTSILDTGMIDSKTQTGKKFMIDKMELSGLADYDRNTGYVNGDVTITQEEVDPDYDRGRKFSVDTMDDLETGYIAFGKLGAEFERTKVIPEVDAYRFGKYASEAGTTKDATITADNIMGEIAEAQAALINAEVPETGNIMFVNASVYGFLKQKAGNRFGTWTDTRINTNIESFDNMPIVVVPQKRFNDTITLTNNGYTAAGRNINFMIINKGAVIQYNKHRASNVISPEDNQNADAYIMKFRDYALAHVYENKTKGIYVNRAEA